MGGSESDKASSIEKTADGGFIVIGTTSSNDGDLSAYNSEYGNSDYWIVKLNSNGSVQWQKRFGGSGLETASSIKQTSDGGYIVAGYTYSNDGDVNGNHGDHDYWILKLDSDGNFQWQKCLGGSQTDYAHSIETTTDGGYIMAGISNSSDGDVTGNHGDFDFWVVKLGADAALPVTLLNFSGEVNGKQNLLHWTTATEQNNTGFEIQRSTNGINFSKIGFVDTKAINGNSNSKITYDFTDNNYSATINYYRLKQIDKDGKFSFSNIVVLKNNNAVALGLYAIYPNPAKNILNVKTSSAGNTKITLLVTDVSGKLIITKQTNVGNGESIIPLDVSHLSAGSYFLKMLCNNGCETAVKKFVKQ
jgi:hypothetical protein